MPIYEYSCKKCGEVIEKIQKFSDPPLKKHAGCGGTLTKLISQSSFQLKGSGWYVTDYAGKGKSEGADGDKKSDGKDSGSDSGDSKSGSDSKSDGDTKSGSDTKGTGDSKSKDSKKSASKASDKAGTGK